MSLEPLLEFILKNPDKANAFIASIALILSIFSTALTIWSVRLQRVHNRVSVRPIGEIILSDYEDLLAVKIRNNGLGPLIITKFQALEQKDIIKDNLIDLMPKHPNTLPWRDFVKKIENRVILPGDELCLLELNIDTNIREYIEFRDLVRKTLEPLAIKFYYKSIYNEIQPICERDLSWFGRNVS